MATISEVFELLFEVPGEQQYGVFEFALVVGEGTLAEFADHHHGAGNDRRDQETAAEDQGEDRPSANWRGNVL